MVQNDNSGLAERATTGESTTLKCDVTLTEYNNFKLLWGSSTTLSNCYELSSTTLAQSSEFETLQNFEYQYGRA